MNREDLIAALDLAAPALSADSQVSANVFKGFCFTKKSITAHNDVIAVRVPKPKGTFQGVFPGRLLLKFLKTCTGKHVEFVQTSKGDSWHVKCGPPKLSLEYHGVNEFPFQFPKSDPILKLRLGQDFFYGLGLCTRIVSDAGLVSWTGGVTFKFDGVLTLASTSATRSQIYCYSVKRELKTKRTQTKILPVSFCKVALSLNRKFSEERIRMEVHDTCVILRFGTVATIIGKTIKPDIDIDIIEKVQDYLEELGDFIPLQDVLREMIERAATISTSNDDICSLKINEDNVARMKTQIVGGIIEDALTLQADHPEISIRSNPKRLASDLSECKEIKVGERLIGFRGGQFVKLIANMGT